MESEPRRGAKASNSSKKRTQGSAARARANSWRTALSLSPTYLFSSSGPCTRISHCQSRRVPHICVVDHWAPSLLEGSMQSSAGHAHACGSRAALLLSQLSWVSFRASRSSEKGHTGLSSANRLPICSAHQNSSEFEVPAVLSSAQRPPAQLRTSSSKMKELIVSLRRLRAVDLYGDRICCAGGMKHHRWCLARDEAGTALGRCFGH